MKSVLISIQPKWCKLIASGKKTVEVRKTKPKIETPFKCYIYCTKGNPTFTQSAFCDDVSNGKVIGEFVCNRIGKFSWCSNPTKADWQDGFDEEACLTYRETYEYTKGGLFYEWHISDLVVYDEPKGLSQVLNRKQAEKCVNGCEHNGLCQYCKEIRPPQSWCYVEEVEG